MKSRSAFAGLTLRDARKTTLAYLFSTFRGSNQMQSHPFQCYCPEKKAKIRTHNVLYYCGWGTIKGKALTKVPLQ
jgi:predicted SprT family Zn-dependent metalloprotease